MKGRCLLALSVLSLALACDQQPTGPTAPTDPSKFIQDGAHNAGNGDFFFLPPLVPFPSRASGFELGKFNNALAGSLQVKICELNPEPLPSGTNLPTNLTKCNPIKPLVAEFGAGTVPLKPIQVVNLPIRQNGWWTLFGLPPDGFYYVLWNPQLASPRIDASKYYRITVTVVGRPNPLGIADLDPMANLREWRFSKTGDVVQMINGFLLPIPFRVEQGALCEGGTCSSATYDNITPLTLPFDPDKTGSTAGVIIPAGALPTHETSPDICPLNPPQPPLENPCPTVVTVKITKVNTDAGGQLPSTICHPDIPFLQQFKGCYEFTTEPKLRRLNQLGDQFIKDVFVAVCYELEGTGNPREKFAQLYSSSTDEEPSKWLDDIPEGTLIGANTKDCTPPVIGSRSSNPLIQFASTGWRKLKGGLSQVFGVKTAYGIDLGLGGLTKGFSHISPVLRVEIQPASFTDVTLPRGQYTTDVSAKIVTQHYHGTDARPGVNTVPVKFSVAEGNGTIKLLNAAGLGVTGSITVNTASLPAGVALSGFSAVTWTVPTDPGTYTMTAEGAAYGGQIVYTATVPPLYEPWHGTADIASAGPVTFGGPPYCFYTVQYTNIHVDMVLNTTGGGGLDVRGLQTERLLTPPCGDIQPAGEHLDVYGSEPAMSAVRIGNHITATLASLGNPIRGELLFDGIMSADQQTVAGTFTWHRLDQGPPLDWTVVGTGTITRVPPPGSLTPALVFTGSEFYTAGGSNWVRYKLGVTNYAVYPAEMFAPAPTLPPCGLNTNSSRTWVDIYDGNTNSRIYGFCGLGTPSDLNLIWFAKPVGTTPPSLVYIKLTDRLTNTVYQSNNVTPIYPP
jgi:hypothetical protein